MPSLLWEGSFGTLDLYLIRAVVQTPYIKLKRPILEILGNTTIKVASSDGGRLPSNPQYSASPLRPTPLSNMVNNYTMPY